MPELESLQAAIASGQWYVVAMAVATLLIRIYRHDGVQAVMPVIARWERLKPWVRWCLVFGSAATAAAVTGLLAGQSLGTAIGAALITALGAVGTHKATKAIGHAQTAAAISKHGLGYEPGFTRKAVDLVVPVDRKALRDAASLRTRVGDNGGAL